MSLTQCPRSIPALQPGRLASPARVPCSWRATLVAGSAARSSASRAISSSAALERWHALRYSGSVKPQTADRCAKRSGGSGGQSPATPLFLALLHSGRRELPVQCMAATSEASTEAESASSLDESSRLLALVRGFERQVVTERGVQLCVRPLATQHLEEVTDLLTDSFLDLLGSFTYRPLLRLEIKVYVARCLASVPDSVLLVGVRKTGSAAGQEQGGGGEVEVEWEDGTGEEHSSNSSNSSSSSRSVGEEAMQPASHSDDSFGSSSASSPARASSPSSPSSPSSLSTLTAAVVAAGQTYSKSPNEQVVAVVQLFLTATNRPSFFLLEPPSESTYLCNMAVLPALRRQGCGAALLSVAEELACLSGSPSLSLHCRLQDLAPLSLYRTRGYQLLKQDGRFAPLLTWQWRRALMCKELPTVGGEEGRGGEDMRGEEGEGGDEEVA